MGLTYVTTKVANPRAPRKTLSMNLLVDSGAIFSVIPASTLRKLGIKPHSVNTFTLADGTQIRRRIGDAVFILNGKRGAAPVIFGQRGDSALLGSISLEALGLFLDPVKRVLKPLPMMLA